MSRGCEALLCQSERKAPASLVREGALCSFHIPLSLNASSPGDPASAMLHCCDAHLMHPCFMHCHPKLMHLLIAGCILTQFQGAALSSLEQCAPTLTSERTIHKKWGEQSRAELLLLVPPFLTAGQQNDIEIVQNRSYPTIDNHRFCSHNQLNPTCKNRSPSVR